MSMLLETKDALLSWVLQTTIIMRMKSGSNG
jgi:hypothetical protein